MRILVYVLLVCLLSLELKAQNKELLYGFNDLPQSLMVNPGAEIKFNRYIGVPGLSNIYASAGLRGGSLYDIFADDGRDINEKINAKLSTMTNKDHLAFNQQLELVNVGWRNKANPSLYFSAGMYQEIDIIAYFPKDFAVLAYRGNQNYINTPFNFSDVSANAELFTVFHFGYNKRVNDRLIFGARAKIYSSIINFRSNNNKGAFVTIESPQGNNIYQHVISNADVSLKTSGYASLRDIESEDTADGTSQVLNKFLGRAFLGGNLGFGFDVGFNYLLDEHWSISGSALDLGMVFYNKDVETYQAKGNYVYEGIETPTTSGAPVQDLLSEFEEAIPLDTLSTSYVTARSLKLNGSIQYAFNRFYEGNCNCYEEGENPPFMDALGMQIFSQFRPKVPQVAASFFYYRRWSDYFRTKINYTIDDYSYYNVGLLISTHFNKINFYLSANNIFEYTNLAKAQGASVQLGFNVIL